MALYLPGVLPEQEGNEPLQMLPFAGGPSQAAKGKQMGRKKASVWINGTRGLGKRILVTQLFRSQSGQALSKALLPATLSLALPGPCPRPIPGTQASDPALSLDHCPQSAPGLILFWRLGARRARQGLIGHWARTPHHDARHVIGYHVSPGFADLRRGIGLLEVPRCSTPVTGFREGEVPRRMFSLRPDIIFAGGDLGRNSQPCLARISSHSRFTCWEILLTSSAMPAESDAAMRLPKRLWNLSGCHLLDACQQIRDRTVSRQLMRFSSRLMARARRWYQCL